MERCQEENDNTNQHMFSVWLRNKEASFKVSKLC